MANMRIIYDNAADVAVITATSSVLPTSNMQNDYKSSAHRSSTTSVTYTLTWTSAVQIGGVALPATNLTGDATIQVKLYTNAGDVSPVADSTAIPACPGANLELWNWSMPLNSNAFIFGGASKSAVWFDNQVSCKKCEIILVDTTNLAGYIDCAKVVAGAYWEPTYNISNGATVVLTDTSGATRNDSGDLLCDRGFIHDSLSFDFSVLLETDKVELLKILRRVGTSRSILVSLAPGENNSIMEQTNTIYGKRSNSGINTELFGIYRHSMELEGW